MQRFLFFVDSTSVWVGKIFGWSILALTLAISYDVFMRYVFRSPTDWGYDVSYMLYGALFMMAGAYALSRNGHVRGDVLYRLMPIRWQAGVDLTLYFLFFFPAVLALMYSGFEYAKMAWVIKEHSALSPDGPPLYHFKSLIPIAGFFLFLQGIAEVVRCIQGIKTGEWPQRLSDVEELEKQIMKDAKDGKSGDEILAAVGSGMHKEDKK
ncbi:MAG: TRAP transporter small permease subunit [Smithellaceae bacterium]|nr:TRAP transporter small permease subunit [Smithellaceae bacterium]